ncbi:hypothetical protein GCM10028791_21210 [Echinicola sediminis]
MRLIIATLMALCTTLTATAHTAGHSDLEKEKEKKETVVLEKIGDKKVQLKFMAEPHGKVLVRIKDANSSVIFKEIIKTEKEFKKNYDLAALAEGDYKFEVFTKEQGAENFSLSLGEKKTAGSNYFTKVKMLDGERVALLIKADGDAKKYIRVMDNGHVIFEDSFEGKSYGKLFKFIKVTSLEDLVFEVKAEKGDARYLSAL